MKTKPLSRVLARRIRALRANAGLSQEELAERAGLHRTYVGAVERAERNVTLRTVERIAAALGVDPVELLKEAGE